MNTTVLAGVLATIRHTPPWEACPAAFLAGPLLLLLFLALLGLAVWYLARRSGDAARGGSAEPPEGAARRVLAERFARGDIDADEFRERAAALGWTVGGSSGRRP
ncbi:putative membrane protein [Haloactinospora alba]|uniref:Putative membrane protein n=1 Tax=Haloactinospora alba TaxID=405555 RepID=A0A543NFU9_9ACTN|nr:SHOCT domain-containing protein [Haloactinospora alba]TQN30650.1 putative membrane protein [Haloactinospora alba]